MSGGRKPSDRRWVVREPVATPQVGIPPRLWVPGTPGLVSEPRPASPPQREHDMLTPGDCGRDPELTPAGECFHSRSRSGGLHACLRRREWLLPPRASRADEIPSDLRWLAETAVTITSRWRSHRSLHWTLRLAVHRAIGTARSLHNDLTASRVPFVTVASSRLGLGGRSLPVSARRDHVADIKCRQGDAMQQHEPCDSVA